MTCNLNNKKTQRFVLFALVVTNPITWLALIGCLMVLLVGLYVAIVRVVIDAIIADWKAAGRKPKRQDFMLLGEADMVKPNPTGWGSVNTGNETKHADTAKDAVDTMAFGLATSGNVIPLATKQSKRGQSAAHAVKAPQAKLKTAKKAKTERMVPSDRVLKGKTVTELELLARDCGLKVSEYSAANSDEYVAYVAKLLKRLKAKRTRQQKAKAKAQA